MKCPVVELRLLCLLLGLSVNNQGSERKLVSLKVLVEMELMY